MLRRLNDSLPGLVLGIVLYGLLLQIAGIWFVSDKIGYTIGLWYGILIAIGTAINMASVIYDCASVGDEYYARKRAVLKSIIRYIVIALAFVLLSVLQFGNLLAGFAGMFGLKISAYLQPLLGKLSRKMIGNNWMFPEYTELPPDADPEGNNVQIELNEEVKK